MSLENPYRLGSYHFTVATLLQMGVNKAHKFTAFTSRLQKVWSKTDAEGWKAFASKEARNKKTAKDLHGRVLQNCRVLQRTKDYGRPLLKAGAVIDLTRGEKGGLMICLNTRSKKPQKPGRAPKAPQPGAKPAKSKAKSTRKPTGRKKRAQKRSVTAPETNRTEKGVSEIPKATVTVDQPKSE